MGIEHGAAATVALPSGARVIGGIVCADVDRFADFQALATPPGWYWCEFYGGTREYRCLLVPQALRRAELLRSPPHLKLLDASIEPIFAADGIAARQDPSHAVPGFYIVAPDEPYRSTDALGLSQYLRMRLVDHEVAEHLRRVLGVRRLLRVNEERQVAYQNVHTWLLPLDRLSDGVSIHDLNTCDFLTHAASWRQQRARIEVLNATMREALAEARLADRVRDFGACIAGVCVETSQRLAAALEAGASISPVASDVTLYRLDGIVIKRRDALAAAGFYVIEPEAAQSCDTLSRTLLYLRMRFLDHVLRVELRLVLGVEHAYKLQQDLQDGRGAPPAPIELLPIHDIGRYDRIYHFRIADYLREHGTSRAPQRDATAHARLKAAFKRIGLADLDRQVSAAMAAALRNSASHG